MELSEVPKAFRPVCKEFQLTGSCAFGDMCWLRHPSAGPVDFQLLLQCQCSHTDRFVSYLEKSYLVEIVQEEKCPATDAKQKSSQMNIFVRVPTNTNPDVILCDLVCDKNLERVFSRGYRVDGRVAFDGELLTAISLDAPQGACRVQAFPRSLESFVAVQINDGTIKGLETHKQDFDNMLCLFQTESGILYGWCKDISRTAAAAICSGGSKDQICRAGYKLTEVLRRCLVATCGGVAVDIGASPGGWSAVLATHCDKVYAVDPAELAEPRANNVIHLQAKAEDCLPELLPNVENITFLVCDMNASPRNVLALIIPLVQYLAHGAVVIVTLKNFIGNQCKTTKGQAIWNGIVEDAVHEFKQHLRDVDMIHLFSNGLQERTMIGFK